MAVTAATAAAGVESSATAVTSGSWSAGTPADGTLIYAFVWSDNTSATLSMTAGGGTWTKVEETNNVVSSALFRKTGASEPSTYTGNTTGSDNGIGIITFAFDVDGGTIAASSTSDQSASTTTTLTSATITVPTGDTVVTIMTGANDTNWAKTTPEPAGLTFLTEQSAGSSQGVVYYDIGATGATSPQTMTWGGTDDNNSIIEAIVITDAAVGGGVPGGLIGGGLLNNSLVNGGLIR